LGFGLWKERMKKIVALLEEAPFVGDMHHKVSVASED